MGSLPSPPRPMAPPRPPSSSNDTQFLNRRIYAAFRMRHPRAKISIDISCYNLSTNTWSHVTSIPGLMDNHGLKDFALVSLGDSIYVVGGLLFHQRVTNCPTAEDDLRVQSSVLRYNLVTGTWSRCAALAIPRYDFACAVSENRIYVAGGKSTLTSAVGLSSSEVYDPESDEWTPLPDMSTSRYKCVGVTWQGKIHVVGGFALKAGTESKQPMSFTPERSSAEVYDARGGAWRVVAGMWQLDVPPNQIVAVDGRLLSSGDCLKVWKGHVEAYDWEQSIWNEVEGSRIETLNCPISHSNYETNMEQQLYLTIAPIGTYLYFLAGCRVEGEQVPKTRSIVHRFDTSALTNAWTSFEAMEEEGEKLLCSHCCVVVPQVP